MSESIISVNLIVGSLIVTTLVMTTYLVISFQVLVKFKFRMDPFAIANIVVNQITYFVIFGILIWLLVSKGDILTVAIERLIMNGMSFLQLLIQCYFVFQAESVRIAINSDDKI